MVLGAIKATILSQYSDKGTKAAQKDLTKLNKKFDDMGRRAVKAANLAVAGFAALSVKIGKDSVRAAIDDNKQQLLLANTLKNVTGASTDQVKAVEAQIAALSNATGVLDDDLRPSLQQFLMLTKDVERAQFLQGIAVELAASAQIDLASATDVISKAYRGQFKGLQNLGIQLDENVVKNKDVAAALRATIDATEGASAAANKADPFIKLNKDIQDLYETLGTALLPVMIDFVSFLRDQLIPEITRWVNANREELVSSLEQVSEKVFGLLEAGMKIDDFLKKFNLSLVGVISELVKFVAVLNLVIAGRTLLALITDTAKFSGAVAVLNKATASGKVLEFFTKLSGAGAAASGVAGKIVSLGAGIKTFAAGTGLAAGAVRILLKVFNAFFKLSPLGKIIALYYGFQLLAKGVTWLKDKLFGTEEVVRKKVVVPMQNAQQATIDYFNTWTERTVQQKKDAEQLAQIEKDKLDAARRAEEIAKTNAIRARIAKKFGVKLTDPETQARIDARAIELNLIRSKKNAEAEIMKQAQILKELNKAALEEEIKLRERIRDILKAYADDQKVDQIEIAALAKLWNTTSEAAELYVEQIIAVSDNKISETEVANLAAMWGISKDQAAKYLDFLKVVSDGKISDAEIRKLADKWNMTITEATKYADFIVAVQDRELNDAEVERLKEKWGLTNEELTAYILGIGAPVKYQGTILDPASIKALEDAWTAALAALNKYKAALGSLASGTPSTSSSGTPSVTGCPAGTTLVNGKCTPITTPKTTDPVLGGSRTDSAASAAAAIEYAVAKAAGDMDAARNAAARVNPSALAAGESGAIGAASIARQLAEAEQAVKIANTYAAFKEKEAREAAEAAKSSLGGSMSDAAADAAERARIRAMQGVMSGGSGGFQNSMAGGNINVNVNVAGSVTAEQDLVQTIRNGLLSAQYNGDQITLQAV